MRAIDEWVLRTARRHNQAWQQRGKRPVHISVNLSHSLFHSNTLLSVVEEALRETGLMAPCLKLELTESIAMRNVDASIVMLTTLKADGGKLSIDDFGTGYSSLSYLQRLPINMVKIDQSFIQEILTQASQAPIVRAIIAMAHSLISSCSPKGSNRRPNGGCCSNWDVTRLKAISSVGRCRRRHLAHCSPRPSGQSRVIHSPAHYRERDFNVMKKSITALFPLRPIGFIQWLPTSG